MKPPQPSSRASTTSGSKMTRGSKAASLFSTCSTDEGGTLFPPIPPICILYFNNIISNSKLDYYNLKKKSDNIRIIYRPSKDHERYSMDAIINHTYQTNEYGYIYVTTPTTGIVHVEFEYQHSSHLESDNQISGLYVGGGLDPPIDNHYYTSSFYLFSLYDGSLYDNGKIRKNSKCHRILPGNRIVLIMNYEKSQMSMTIRNKLGYHEDLGVLFNNIPNNIQPVVCSSYGNIDNERIRLVEIKWNDELYSNPDKPIEEVTEDVVEEMKPKDSQSLANPDVVQTANKLLKDPELLAS